MDIARSVMGAGKKIVKLADGLHTIPESVMMDSNIYFLGEKPDITMFDTGNGLTTRGILKALRDNDISFDDIKRVVMTHSHYDHMGGLYYFRKKFDFELCASEDESTFIEQGDARYICPFMPIRCPPTAVDTKLVDGDVLEVGDFKLRAISTPGHTAGSLCFYDEEHRVLISGDTVFTNGSMGRVDLPTGSRDAMLQSLKMLSTLDVDFLLPGHMKPVNDGSQHIGLACRYAETLL